MDQAFASGQSHLAQLKWSEWISSSGYARHPLTKAKVIPPVEIAANFARAVEWTVSRSSYFWA